jgi:uncharacterized protein with ParB-like and HNH nuclease domain
MNSINAQDSTINLLLNEWEKIEVPDFQRKYVWDKKEITDFIESVITADYGLYVGTIVITPESGKSAMRIIDGQQRLVTISLLLLAVRDLMHEIKNKVIAEANLDVISDIEEKISNIDRLLLNKHLDEKNKIKAEPRMHFGSDKYLHNYYWALVKEYSEISTLDQLKSFGANSEPSNYSPAKRIIVNFELVKSYIENYILEKNINASIDHYKELVDVQNRIEQLIAVSIEVTSYEHAFEIYEGLNSKGVELNVSDLMRSLIYRHGMENPDLIDDWEKLDAIFYDKPNNIFPKFLRRFWISKNGYISSGELYKDIKNRISGDQKFASTFTRDIIEDSRFYFSILNNHTDELKTFLPRHNQDIYPYFDRFRLLKNDQIYEVLIAIQDKLQTIERVRSSAVKNILWSFWVMVFRASYTLVSPSKYERKFADYCKKIQKLTYSDFVLFSNEFLRSELAPLVADSNSFVDSISTYEFKANEGLATFILAELIHNQENRRQDFESVMAKIREGNTSFYTLEHIVPKEPKERWNLYKKDVNNLIPRLGNFTFLTPDQNYLAGNKRFKDKYSDVYSKTGFKHHSALREYQLQFEGSLNDIEQSILGRGRALAVLLEDFYKL